MTIELRAAGVIVTEDTQPAELSDGQIISVPLVLKRYAEFSEPVASLSTRVERVEIEVEPPTLPTGG